MGKDRNGREKVTGKAGMGYLDVSDDGVCAPRGWLTASADSDFDVPGHRIPFGQRSTRWNSKRAMNAGLNPLKVADAG